MILKQKYPGSLRRAPRQADERDRSGDQGDEAGTPDRPAREDRPGGQKRPPGGAEDVDGADPSAPAPEVTHPAGGEPEREDRRREDLQIDRGTRDGG